MLKQNKRRKDRGGESIISISRITSDSSVADSWIIEYYPQARNDMKRLDGSQRLLVLKAIQKVSKNPLPSTEGGYGKLLDSKKGAHFTGLYKIKIRDAGLRMAYYLRRAHP